MPGSFIYGSIPSRRSDDPHGHGEGKFGVVLVTFCPNGVESWHSHVFSTGIFHIDEVIVHRHLRDGSIEQLPYSARFPNDAVRVKGKAESVLSAAVEALESGDRPKS